MRKDLFDSIRDRMDSFEEAAPEGLWDEIISSVPSKEKKRARIVALPWVWRSVGAAAAVALGIFIISNRPEHSIKTDTASLNETVKASDSNPSSSVHVMEAIVPEAVDNAVSVSRAGSSMLAALTPMEEEVSRRDVSDEPSAQSLAGDEHRGADNTVSSPDISKKQEQDAPEIVYPKSVTPHEGEDWSGRKTLDVRSGHRARPSNVDLLVSGTMTQSRSQDFFDPRKFYRGAAPADPDTDEDSEQTSNGGNRTPSRRVPISQLSKVNTTTRHYRPVRLAATASWQLTDLFSVETGLAWTMLQSDFTSSSGVATSKDKQTLQYLGIPVNLSCNIADAGLFSFYVSGGGMVEKCISGTKRSYEYVSGSLMSDTSTSVSVDPLLWSLNAFAGIQASIFNNVGLYFEPGLSYHFDDGSSVQTIYKERPLDFMMTFGLRVSFK